MSVILVVEQDASYAQRLSASLQGSGHQVASVATCEAAKQLLAEKTPSLLLASGVMSGAQELLSRFSKRRGGPGSIVLLPVGLASGADPAAYHADRLLPKPFSDEDLRRVIDQTLASGNQAPPITSVRPAGGGGLTSEDIFGDVLAEVEAEVQNKPKPSAKARRKSAEADVNRKLEETLSGFFPEKLQRPPSGTAQPTAASSATSKPAPKRRKRDVPSADEIDDLLDKTLSSLELPGISRKKGAGAGAKRAKPTPASGLAGGPAHEPAKPSVPSPTTAPPSTPQPKPPISAASQAASTPVGPASFQAPETHPVGTATPGSSTPLEPPPESSPFEPPSFDAPAPGLPATDAGTPGPPVSKPSQRADSSPAGWSAEAFDDAPDAPAAASPAPGAAEDEDDFPISFGNEPPSSTDSGFFSGGFSDFGTPKYPTSFAPEQDSPPASSPLPAAPPAPALQAPEAEAFEPPTFDSVPLDPVPFDPVPLEPPSFTSDSPGQPPNESVFGASSFLPDSESGNSPEAFATTKLPSLHSYGQEELRPPTDAGQEAEVAPPAFDSQSGVWDANDPPTDFTNAFASTVPPAPLPTLDPDPGDSSGELHRTLEGVLQIRDQDGGAMASSDEGVPFGDYRLLDRVAVGGMAEVWRARRRGVEGFQKTVAIKRILSHLTGSSDFVTMFIDEAKLAAQLNHANIIQIYDLGKVDDDFYIAMEFVEGRDLRTILTQTEETNTRIPLDLGLTIVAALARALSYAHRKRDFDHQELGLVHRDVSPQNVLISYEGEIKLCDFGIVKAVAKASTTQMGALKGKLQYMSPEQAWGKEVDARSDIFSLGSVMFEVLTGERLFTGDSEIGVLDAVRDCRVRSPRSLVPSIPEEVDAIVLKALAADPKARYQTAADLEKDIATVLEARKPTLGQSDLALFMQQLFGVEPSHPMAAPAAASSTGNAVAGLPTGAPANAPADAPADAPASTVDPALATSASASRTGAVPAPKEKKKSSATAKTLLIVAIGLAALLAIALILMQVLDRDESKPSSGAATPAVVVAPANDSPPTGSEDLTLPSTADGEAGGATDDPAASDNPAGEGDSGAGEGTTSGEDNAAPPADAEGQVASPATETEPETDSSTQEDGAAQGQDEIQEMIDQAMADEQQRLEADFEARKRQLEAELRRLQQEGSGGGGGGGQD